MRWSIDAGEVDLALRLLAGLWRYWQLDGHLAEGAELAEAAMSLPGAELPTPHRLAAVTALGNIAYWQGRTDEAVRWYEEQLALARELGDRAAEADAMFNLSYGAFIREDFALTYELVETARKLYLEIGDARGAARTEWSLATAVDERGTAGGCPADVRGSRGTLRRARRCLVPRDGDGSIAWAKFATGRHARRHATSSWSPWPSTARCGISGRPRSRSRSARSSR